LPLPPTLTNTSMRPAISVNIKGARTSLRWYPQIDVNALVVVLTGALGLHEPEEEPRTFTPLDVARHAPLFIRELLATDRTPKTLRQYFAAGFAHISQSEQNELP
jgi:hypothetical protein